MTVISCVDCMHANLQGAKVMTRNGFTLCAKKEKWHFEGLTRLHECPMFEAAPAERSTERREWLSKLRESRA